MEEKIAATVIGGMASMDGMAGDDTAMLDAITRVVETSSRELDAA